MPVKIENRYKSRIYLFNIERNIRYLLKVIPKQDLIGLEKIVIVDEFKSKKSKTAAAIYNKKTKLEPTSIKISFRSVFKGMPSFLFLFPFIAKFSLASVLYHEIGHHYHHTFEHGINNRKKEEYADNYKKIMMKKRFRFWGSLLRPFTPLVKYISEKV